MKKIITILSIILLISCNDVKFNTVNEIKKIKIGQSINEVKYLLGEPYNIGIENGYDLYYFRYETGNSRNTFEITFKDDIVVDFESY